MPKALYRHSLTSNTHIIRTFKRHVSMFIVRCLISLSLIGTYRLPPYPLSLPVSVLYSLIVK